MKKFTILIGICLWCSFAHLEAQDLPNPQQNLQLMPEGSYVIAMDDLYQSNTNTNPTKQYFNLKAYGLVVYLLNNNIKVKRVIKSGKAKDEADITVASKMAKPVAETSPVTRTFKSGPFVIFANDAFRFDLPRLIENYNNNAGGVSGIADPNYKIKVYQTAADVQVDVRFDYTGFRPKASILNDGGNAGIHEDYMEFAGIPKINYTIDYNTDLVKGCYTFASEPHNNNPQASVVTNITNFLMAGGNFLAQCDAIPKYEALGHFHTTNGFTITNSNVSPVVYPHPDLNFSQFDGSFSVNQGGSCTNWKPATSSNPTNHVHNIATAADGSGNSIGPVGASASKVNGLSTPGGMVFYLGNHSFKSITNKDNINGIRMYMNAFLTPASMQNMIKYVYQMSCNNSAMKVNAEGGPATAYPVTFHLYADNGSEPGNVDPGDAFIGAATVNSANDIKSIYVAPPYNNNTPFVMRISPTVSCFATEVVQPSSCNYITLATELKEFKGQVQSTFSSLQWKTVDEDDISGFYVQRFQNNAWMNLAFIQSNKSLQTQHVYSYDDASERREVMQYRLALVSKNGDVRYSKILSLNTTATNAAAVFSVFPTPSVDGKVMVRFKNSSAKTIAVLDQNGRVIFSKRISNTLSTDISGLKAGQYLLRIQEGNNLPVSQKLVVQ